MRNSITRLFALIFALAAAWLLQSCGFQEDYRLTLSCKGSNEVLSKLAQQPATSETTEQTRRYAFELRELNGYHCHTWRKEKIACIRSQEDDDSFIHESVTIHRTSMDVAHITTTEKKKIGLVQEESFQGKCRPVIAE